MYVHYSQGEYSRIDEGPKHVKTLAWELRYTMLRREPKDVFEEVPPVTYTTIKVEMTGKQRESYDVARKEALLQFEGQEEIPIPNAIARIMRLRQIACDPSLISAPGESAKLDALNDLVGMSEEPVIIFTTFRSVAEQVVKRFEGCSLYIGGSSEKEIEDFTTGRTNILVGTTGAMSEGFNLQRARRMVFVDLPWSSVKYIQAVGRIRPGLDGRIVEVINIEARNSVDSVVKDVLDGKLSGSSEVYSAIRESLRGNYSK